MASEGSSTSKRRELSLNDYFVGVRSGDVAVLARTLTLMESTHPSHREMAEQLLADLLPHTGNSLRVGITGTPGVGKSTFIEALGLHLVRSGRRVAVLAVDPSSEISGGSILGDKTRMPELAAEANSFIRPAPSAGTLGGVASRTRESLLVCEAAGYDVVLVETVGVGQSETLVADMTDCFLALMQAGAGDELQGIKRGLLELVDVVAVNKADGAGRVAAQQTASQLESALHTQSKQRVSVFTCSALEGTGIVAVWQAIEAHMKEQSDSGTLVKKRGQQSVRWMWNLVEQRLLQALHSQPELAQLRESLQANVLSGALSAEAAASSFLEQVGLLKK